MSRSDNERIEDILRASRRLQEDDIGPLIEMLQDEYTPPPSGSVFDEDHSFPTVELTE